MKPEAVAEQIRKNANESLKGALEGLKEADTKVAAIGILENVPERIIGNFNKGYESCRGELEMVSKLSQIVLDEVPKYTTASKNGDSEGMQKCLRTIADTDSEIEMSLARVRGFQRRLHALADKIEAAG